MPVHAGTIEFLHHFDYDGTPFDFLPRDYRSENERQADDQFKMTDDEIARAEEQDAEYIRSWQADEWHYIGIQARVTLVITDEHGHAFTREERSPGLWRVEDNSDPDYIRSIEEEERAELVSALTAEYPDIVFEEA